MKSIRLILVLAATCLALACQTAGPAKITHEEGYKDIIKSLVIPPDFKSGTYSFKWDDGSAKASGMVRNSKKAGAWKLYFKGQPSKLMAEGAFVDDQLEGEWKEYGTNGKMKNKYIYRKGAIYSLLIFYESGYPHKEEYYQGELKHGKSMEYHENGNPKEICYYKEGKKDGQTNIFYSNGSKKEIGSYLAGNKEGRWMYYNEDNKLIRDGHYKNGKKTGKWIYYGENGQKEEKIYD